MRSIIRYVNLMDRAALRGEDPQAALKRSLQVFNPGNVSSAFRDQCIDGYERRLLNRQRSADIARAECQICGRRIGYETGRIAHHGYKRPGMGWQTPSCFGAKRLSYDVAHDALDEYVIWLKGVIKYRQLALGNHMVDPPAKLTHFPTHLNRHGPRPAPIELIRPEVFDPSVPTTPRCYSRLEMTYGKKFHVMAEHWRSEIHQMTAEIKFAKDRIAAWKPKDRK